MSRAAADAPNAASERRLIFPDLETLSAYAAQQWVARAQDATAQRGRFLAALAGGETPQRLYTWLIEPRFRDQIPWAHTYLFWGDERSAPPESPGSNYGAAWRGWLAQAPIPAGQIWPIRGELSAEAAAQDYAATLRQFADPGLAWPVFDLVLLGMGTDGHTASLFPGLALSADTPPTLAVTAHYGDRPAQRVTLTPPVFNSAREVWVLVAGANKAQTLAQVWSEEPPQPDRWPIQRIRPNAGRLVWLVDNAAAGLVG